MRGSSASQTANIAWLRCGPAKATTIIASSSEGMESRVSRICSSPPSAGRGRSGNHAQHQTKQRGAEGDDKSAADGGRRAAQQSAQHIAAEVIGSQKEGDFA